MDINESFEYITLELKPDYEGRCIATLIASKENTHNRDAVLHFHGHTDYFYNPEIAEKFHENGYDFYAITLRKFAHSFLPHQSVNFCKDLHEYHEEISISIDKIKEVNNHKIIILAHSFGGLVASHYMNYGAQKDDIDLVMYNAPMLGFAGNPIINNIKYNAAKLASIFKPMGYMIHQFNPAYISSTHKDIMGEWDFRLDWKPVRGNQIYLKWVVCIYEALIDINKNSDIKQPILVLHPSKSTVPKTLDDPEIFSSDTILDVEHMKKGGPNLGNNVTMVEIKDALHDLFNSRKPVRELAYSKMFEWLQKHKK